MPKVDLNSPETNFNVIINLNSILSNINYISLINIKNSPSKDMNFKNNNKPLYSMQSNVSKKVNLST